MARKRVGGGPDGLVGIDPGHVRLEIVSTLRLPSNVKRVAALLSTLAGADVADGWRIDVAQADLAAMAALARTTLIEALRELEALGLVDNGYRAVRLRDVAGLVALRDGMANAAQP